MKMEGIKTGERSVIGENYDRGEYNKNVQTSRHVGFRVFWALLEGRRWAGAIQLQKTAFPQMNLQKDIRDCVQYD